MSAPAAFREKYLTHEELTAQVKAWAAAHPSVVRLTSLAVTEEGRDIWLLTIGPDPDEVRPAVWVDGNMHAMELAGSSAALAIAEDVIRLHTEPDAELHGLPRHVLDFLRGVKLFVLPRMSPDGAEEVLNVGRWVRSVPRVGRDGRSAPYWRAQDLDGDGLSLMMRVEDPAGEYVEVGGMMAPREIEDPPPYYRVYAEGVIENWNGRDIPDPQLYDDTYPDLNRNFPFDWAPEHEQVGAGEYPGSEVESRAVIERATKHPEICAWINFHCFGGVFIRPCGDKPDNKMDANDLAIYRQLGVWADDIVGYPMVSGFEEFTYSPETPLHGDLSEWAYAVRGAIAYVCELWDLWARLGHERPKRFVEHYSKLGRAELAGFAKYDREHNEGRAIRPWKKVDHPQLGAVEVGGLDPRIGVWNPPYDMLAEVCEKQSAMWLRVAAMAPRLSLDVEAPRSAGDARVIDARVSNVGYLPTYVTSAGKKLEHNEGLWADVAASDGVEVLAPVGGRVEIGHLEGWGHGILRGETSVHFVRGSGTSHARNLSWTVRGSGTLTLRIGSRRVGWIEKTIEI